MQVDQIIKGFVLRHTFTADIRIKHVRIPHIGAYYMLQIEQHSFATAKVHMEVVKVIKILPQRHSYLVQKEYENVKFATTRSKLHSFVLLQEDRSLLLSTQAVWEYQKLMIEHGQKKARAFHIDAAFRDAARSVPPGTISVSEMEAVAKKSCILPLRGFH